MDGAALQHYTWHMTLIERDGRRWVCYRLTHAADQASVLFAGEFLAEHAGVLQSSRHIGAVLDAVEALYDGYPLVAWRTCLAGPGAMYRVP